MLGVCSKNKKKTANSVQIKLVKSETAKSCLSACLKKSCDHTVLNSFLKEVDRLREAG